MPQDTSKTKDIGGVSYEVFMLPPRVGMSMLVDIGKVVGPALGLVNAGSEDGNENEMFMKVASTLISGIDKQTLNYVCDKLSEVTHVNGMPLDKVFDSHFMGKMGSLFQWLVFALEVQYSDFLNALGSASDLVPGVVKGA